MVDSNKRNDSLVVSHLCGTRNCLKRTHLVLEQKWVNDQRKYCHALVHYLARAGRWEQMKVLRKQVRKACPHMPRCFSYMSGLYTIDERVIVDTVKVEL